mmetsp:Transcript_4526/g.14344  ORF Transcript_4526/g.14344 Transcript_4526/m.14344 type:complete len:395 (-) Transcript_4526:33-1217(-)
MDSQLHGRGPPYGATQGEEAPADGDDSPNAAGNDGAPYGAPFNHAANGAHAQPTAMPHAYESRTYDPPSPTGADRHPPRHRVHHDPHHDQHEQHEQHHDQHNEQREQPPQREHHEGRYEAAPAEASWFDSHAGMYAPRPSDAGFLAQQPWREGSQYQYPPQNMPPQQLPQPRGQFYNPQQQYYREGAPDTGRGPPRWAPQPGGPPPHVLDAQRAAAAAKQTYDRERYAAAVDFGAGRGAPASAKPVRSARRWENVEEAVLKAYLEAGNVDWDFIGGRLGRSGHAVRNHWSHMRKKMPLAYLLKINTNARPNENHHPHPDLLLPDAPPSVVPSVVMGAGPPPMGAPPPARVAEGSPPPRDDEEDEDHDDAAADADEDDADDDDRAAKRTRFDALE